MMLKNNQKKFSQEEVNEKRAKQKKKKLQLKLSIANSRCAIIGKISIFFFILMNALETNSSA